MSRKVIIIVAVILVLALLGIMIGIAKNNDSDSNVNSTTEFEPTVDEDKKPPSEIPWTLIVVIIVGLGLAGLLYLIVKRRPKQNIIDCVPSNIAIDIVKNDIINKYKIQCVFPGGKQTPTNSRNFIEMHRDVSVIEGTNDYFVRLNLLIKDGPHPGLHSLIIPLHKGEQWLKDGNYTHEIHAGPSVTKKYRDKMFVPTTIESSEATRRVKIIAEYMASMGRDASQASALEILQAERSLKELEAPTEQKKVEKPIPKRENYEESNKTKIEPRKKAKEWEPYDKL